MLRVTSLTEKEIYEIGEAFANHNYVDGEKGMYSYFRNYDAVCRYISDYARRAMERGNLYSTSDNHEAYISFRTSNESMVDGGMGTSMNEKPYAIGNLKTLGEPGVFCMLIPSLKCS